MQPGVNSNIVNNIVLFTKITCYESRSHAKCSYQKKEKWRVGQWETLALVMVSQICIPMPKLIKTHTLNMCNLLYNSLKLKYKIIYIKIKCINCTKFWQGSQETDHLNIGWCERKMVQPIWKTFWWFLKKQN